MKTEGLIVGAALAYLFLRCRGGANMGIGRTFVRPQYDTRRLYDIGRAGAAGYPSHIPLKQAYPTTAVAALPNRASTTLYSQNWQKPSPWRWEVERQQTPWNGYDLGLRPKYYETVKWRTF